jgi:triacylglycerol esterase/lipase EstA (alpha/beta hydrolase family)
MSRVASLCRPVALAVLCVALVAAPQVSAEQFAPVDRAGPPLSVPRADLDRALVCAGDLRRAPLPPVLLVPGTNVTPQEFAWNYARSFAREGRPFCTVELPVQSTADAQVAAEYLVHALRTMHRRAARRVDVVGHSQGGMLPRWALRFWPDTRRLVDDLVGLAPSNHGTVLSQATCVPGCPAAHRQQAAGSRFLAALNSRTETFAGIDYTVVYTHYDEVVVPNQDETGSSSLRGAPGHRVVNVATQDVCATSTADHLSIGTYDPVAEAVARDALDRPGPAAPSRVSADTCTRAFHSGVVPATFAQEYGETLRLLATAYTVAPSTMTEPPLKRYVFA